MNHLSSIRECDPLILDTANGPLHANKDIPLCVAALGENVAPLVLDATPDVLSLGRRIVDDGYSLWWPGYSLEPQFTHPVTGALIPLRVED